MTWAPASLARVGQRAERGHQRPSVLSQRWQVLCVRRQALHLDDDDRTLNGRLEKRAQIPRHDIDSIRVPLAVLLAMPEQLPALPT